MCCECVEVMEGGVIKDDEDGDKIHEELVTDLNRIHKKIVQETGESEAELGPEDVSLLERCPHFRGASMELGPEDVSLLERCPYFRGWYIQASMELGPEDVSLLERCPHFRGWYV